jgi:hypothetical protein
MGHHDRVRRDTAVRRPELWLDPSFGWPRQDGQAPGDEDRTLVSDALAQQLLDWGDAWRERTDDEGRFDDEAAEAAHVQQGLGLRSRLQRELDRPVAFDRP